jgi:hypothetical protein
LDNSDEEIHEHDVPAEHQQNICNPSHELVLRLLNVEGSLSPYDADRHDDEAESPKSLTIGIRVIENNHKDDAEGRDHHNVVS